MSRIAVVRKEDCNPIGCGGYLCIRVCPINRKLGNEECIYKDHDTKAGIDEELCIGCDICVKKCPFGAIDIINLPAELNKPPIHQYGRNGFHLYQLPIPQFGKVVGILGRNGIGKSTAMQILSGLLHPNLGDWQKGITASLKDLVEFFKGTEAQFYFEKLQEGRIVLSYKPQQVDLIPKTTKGKVKTLLQKVDEREKYEEVVNILGLKHILENEIQTLSGGELQRVAIAACVLRKANVYIFDEPTSYLDIYQRIAVSKFIRSIADKETAVLVVEHDLIILDYMADLVHLMYGKETAYGIVSLPKATRNGINVYLEGYIKEENMRFRDHKIVFEPKPPAEKRKDTPVLVSWNNIKHEQGHFKLEAAAGQLKKHSVTGVLGPNGIGKTTFVKILAGVIKAKQGSIEGDIKVAYKPQYIESWEGTVQDLLGPYLQKHEVTVMRPLHMDKLLSKNIKELSGGELQRVAIAHCLCQDADLFLLDEPSAYLDVEQRLIVAKLIRNMMEDTGKTCLLVEHDLLFVDMVSDNIIVFEGTPAEKGIVTGPFSMQKGMNTFLTDLSLTMRRDETSHRPRINKSGSVKDREQKEADKRYYV